MKTILFLIAAALTQLVLAADGEPKDFWQRPKVELPAKLQPAKLDILSRPDLSRALALFDPDHKVTNPAIEPFVQKADEDYRVVPDGMAKGAKPFSDRKFVINELPARLTGLTQVQLRMSHKSVVDGRFGLILSAARPTLLFLAVDERMIGTFRQQGTPSWMQEFAPTGDRITTDDPLMKAQGMGYLVFVRTCPAGRIALGPAGADPKFNSMYMAFAAAAE
jgi:hypothetical protein